MDLLDANETDSVVCAALVGAVSVAVEVTRPILEGEDARDLVGDPFGGRVVGEADVEGPRRR